MDYSDSSTRDSRRKNRYNSDIYRGRRVTPKHRGDRIKTQLDDLGEIERVFNYDTEESDDGGRYGNIKIINMPWDGKRREKRGKFDRRDYEDDYGDSEEVPLVEINKQKDLSGKMLAHKPPPKKIDFSNKLNELTNYIHPYGFFWTLWTFFVILLCIYELLMVPFVVAFKFLGNGGLYTFDYLVDFFFLCDILLLFYVARAPKTYYLITDKTRIQVISNI